MLPVQTLPVQALSMQVPPVRMLPVRMLPVRMLPVRMLPVQTLPVQALSMQEAPWVAPARSGQERRAGPAPQVALTVHFVPAPLRVWQVFAQRALDWPVARRGFGRAPLLSRSKPDTTDCKPTSVACAAA
jgi:hypothetical protein